MEKSRSRNVDACAKLGIEVFAARRRPRDAWSECRARISEAGRHASGKAAAAAVVAGWLPCLLNATIVDSSSKVHDGFTIAT